ncbi:hypothetical protein Pelo_9447 [Pelomyxa schiedti]|nr:hypothetical protein Pelo_9447 [Pelomyxa schiedti]
MYQPFSFSSGRNLSTTHNSTSSPTIAMFVPGFFPTNSANDGDYVAVTGSAATSPHPVWSHSSHHPISTAAFKSDYSDDEDREGEGRGNYGMPWYVMNEEEVVVRGWLMKEGAIHRTWNRRWFQNTSDDLTQLKYYTDASCSKSGLKGVIDLHTVKSLQIGKQRATLSERILTGIVLQTDDRMWKLVAEGLTEADYWKRGLKHLLMMINQVKEESVIPPSKYIASVSGSHSERTHSPHEKDHDPAESHHPKHHKSSNHSTEPPQGDSSDNSHHHRSHHHSPAHHSKKDSPTLSHQSSNSTPHSSTPSSSPSTTTKNPANSSSPTNGTTTGTGSNLSTSSTVTTTNTTTPVTSPLNGTSASTNTESQSTAASHDSTATGAITTTTPTYTPVCTPTSTNPLSDP